MRKGISPLVAAVILIAATMSIAGILSYWTTGFVKTKLCIAENATEETRCLNAEFKLYSGSYDEDEGKLYLVLENTRTYELTLTDIYLFDSNGVLIQPTITLNQKLEQLTPIEKENIPTFERGIIKTNCPEVSVEFTYSQVTS